MTHEEKINYMRIACSICNYGFSHEQVDLMVSLYEMVRLTDGNGTLKGVLDIHEVVKQRAEDRRNESKKPTED